MTTHLDEIEAWQFASKQFMAAIDALPPEQTALAYIQRFAFDRADGGTKILWVEGKIHLMATVVRDELNRSVLVMYP